jgi:hypothetical protein
MKKALFISAFMLVALATFAQNNPEPVQTLFQQEGPIGWWVGPEFSITQIDERPAQLGGFGGGIIINRKLSIGLVGYGVLNSYNLDYTGIVDSADVYFYSGYGGLKLEYRINPTKPVHIAFPLVIGGGAAGYSTWNYSDPYEDDVEWDDELWDSYFVIEPGVSVGLNLLKWMRLDGGVTYRYVPNLSLPKTGDNVMSGFNLNFSLKFGRF